MQSNSTLKNKRSNTNHIPITYYKIYTYTLQCNSVYNPIVDPWHLVYLLYTFIFLKCMASMWVDTPVPWILRGRFTPPGCTSEVSSCAVARPPKPAPLVAKTRPTKNATRVKGFLGFLGILTHKYSIYIYVNIYIYIWYIWYMCIYIYIYI